MRLSSILGLVVVTASFALGGCAADAEPANEGTPNVALSDPTAVDVGRDRTTDVNQTGKVSDQYANPSNETIARQVETWSGGVADPRIDAVPSGFNTVQPGLIEVRPSAFNPLTTLQIGVRAEEGTTPYMHEKP